MSNIPFYFFKNQALKMRSLGQRSIKALICITLAVMLTWLGQMDTAITYAAQGRMTPGEYQLKAVYLYNFLNFVYWPEKKCTSSTMGPREITVIGKSPVQATLQALQVKLAKAGTPITITFLGSYRESLDLSGCGLLFISNSEKDNFAKIVHRVAGQPILTVADSEEFIEAGGMITLISRQNKLRWVINQKIARTGGLQVNAKLLDVADRVIK